MGSCCQCQLVVRDGLGTYRFGLAFFGRRRCAHRIEEFGLARLRGIKEGIEEASGVTADDGTPAGEPRVVEANLNQLPQDVVPPDQRWFRGSRVGGEYERSRRERWQGSVGRADDQHSVERCHQNRQVGLIHGSRRQRAGADDGWVHELDRNVLRMIVSVGRSHEQPATSSENPRQIERCGCEVGHDSLCSVGVSGTSDAKASTSSS